MNTKEYIESGILEAYVLGTANPQQQREVECMSSIYPEIRQELDALSAAMEAYAQTFSREPPADLKAHILTKLEFGNAPVEANVNSPQVDSSLSETPIRPLFSEEELSDSRPTYRISWLVAASLGLIVLVFAYFLYSQLQGSQQTLSSLRASNEQLTEEVRLLRSRQSESEQKMAFLKEPDTRIIQLNSADSTTADRVTVYWNRSTGQVNLEIDSLASPPETQQYQLWAIVGGKPVDAGVFDIKDDSRLIYQSGKILKADAFAVTLERRGGNPTPTLSAMVVVGNVKT